MERLGGYEVLGEIGRGGMGRVLRARHATTGALRAVKVLDRTSDPELVARFRRESEALARVGPDVAVAIHDVGREESRIFYVMDLLEGGSLADRIARAGKLPWREATALGARLARAVGRCHALGVVHRDLKPANVLFDATDAPRLADFGCARDLGAASLTETGTLLGTPGYMAPEQLEGKRGDAPSDVYALGAIVRELVTGERLRGRGTWSEIIAQRSSPVPPMAPALAPPALDAVVARALATDPAERPSAIVLASELEALLAGGARGRRETRRSLVSLLPLALGALVLVLWLRRSRPPEPERAPVAHAAAAVAPVGSPDLEWLASHGEGRAELDRLAREAAVRPLAEVRAALARHPGDSALAVLELVATVASTSDLGAREAALTRLKGRPVEGRARALFVAVAAVSKIVQDLTAQREHESPYDAAGRLEPLLALADRPDLLGATAAPLASECRLYLEARYGVSESNLIGEMLGTLALHPASRDVLPVAFQVAWLRAQKGNWPRRQLDERCSRLERLAAALAASDPELAAHAAALAFERRPDVTFDNVSDLEDADFLFERVARSGADFAPRARDMLASDASNKLEDVRGNVEGMLRALSARRDRASDPGERRVLTRWLVSISVLLDAFTPVARLARARDREWAAPSPKGEEPFVAGVFDEPIDLLLDETPDLAALDRATRHALAVPTPGEDGGATAHAIRARVLRRLGDEAGVRAERKAVLDTPSAPGMPPWANRIEVLSVRLAAFVRLPLGPRSEPDGPALVGPVEHRTGRADGDGWSAREGPDPAGVLLAQGSGRFALSEGKHVARFTLGTDGRATGDEELARISVQDATDEAFLAGRTILASEFLPPLAVPTDFALPFTCPTGGHPIKVRIVWSGQGFLKAERVALGR